MSILRDVELGFGIGGRVTRVFGGGGRLTFAGTSAGVTAVVANFLHKSAGLASDDAACVCVGATAGAGGRMGPLGRAATPD